MKNILVKDLMVSLSEYATVPESATLFEAVLLLEKAQNNFKQTGHSHRAVLVLNSNNQVIGKLSQLDVLRAIEPKNDQMDKIKEISCYGFTQNFINKAREQCLLNGVTMENRLKPSIDLNVKNFMQSLSEGEYVEEDTSLLTVIHQLIMGTHLSLLVTKKKEIVGILKMTDVFTAVSRLMKESK